MSRIFYLNGAKMIRIAALAFQPSAGCFMENARRIARIMHQEADADLIFCPNGALSGLPEASSRGFKRMIEEALACLHEAARGLKQEVLLPLDGRVVQLGVGLACPRIVSDDAVQTHVGVKVVFSESASAGQIEWRPFSLRTVGRVRAEGLEALKPARGAAAVSTNLVGGAAGLVYAGGCSAACMDAVSELPMMQEGAVGAEFELESFGFKMNSLNAPRGGEFSSIALVHEALKKGIAGYIEETGAKGVVVGLSGGVDSAVSAALAVESLGPEAVYGIALSSRYTSEESRTLVKKLCSGLGIEYREVSIDSLHGMMLKDVESTCGVKLAGGVTDQNIQARLRGMWLMALANELGSLMLCNANKSECAMGYGTLYGDIAGGLAPLADLWKSEVWELAREINRCSGREVIPNEIIEREPTAELYPGQKDSDSLPPYDEIEAGLERAFAVEDFSSLDDSDRAILMRFLRSSFKRAQSPLALVVSETPLSKFDSMWGMNRRI